MSQSGHRPEGGGQAPFTIEVADLGNGRYGLISGWRRLTALTRLSAVDSAVFGTVLAQIRHPATAATAYIAMVKENEIRSGLSYYERAPVTAKAVEAGVFPTEKAALQQLFSASKPGAAVQDRIVPDHPSPSGRRPALSRRAARTAGPCAGSPA